MTPTASTSKLSAHVWLVVLCIATAYLGVAAVIRTRHIVQMSAIGESASPPAGRAHLIVPEHDNASYEWLDQTRQMIEQGEWRVRRLDYENAPYGREVFAASPYRWWLGLIAGVDRLVSGDTVTASLERAAILADPLIQISLLIWATLFARRRFGPFAAALVAAGLATFFPLTAEFLPGMPEDRGLAQALAIGSLLLLLAGMEAAYSRAEDAARRAKHLFIGAGIVGGIGLWVSVYVQVPVITGVILGAILAGFLSKTEAAGNEPVLLPWRAWMIAGAVTTLLACAIEFFPANLGSWQLRAIHPLYGLAWLGGGEIAARASAWLQGRRDRFKWSGLVVWVLALAAVAGLPVAMRLNHNLGFLEGELATQQLARLPDAPMAPDFGKWIFRDGLTAMTFAAIMPLLLLIPAVGLLINGGRRGLRARLAVTLTVAVIALAFACRSLSAWSGVGAALVVLVAAAVAAPPGAGLSTGQRWTWAGLLAVGVLPGAVQFFPKIASRSEHSLNEQEVYSLIERDLARWLVLRAGQPGTIVLSPHNEAFTLHHFGGLRGLATLGWENLDGLEGAMRIVSASTPEEARELIDKRGIRFLVIPSWDSYFNVYAQIGMGKVEDTFLSRLQHWRLPSWLRPVAYEIPTISGFEGQTVTVLEVVEDQEDAAALSRLAEYFIELGQLDFAANTAQALRRYPSDFGALVARAQVELARGDADAFAKSIEQLRSRLNAGGDRGLSWDRRLSLAVVLARAKLNDLAAVQVRKCAADADEAGLRSLSTAALYRLEVLARAYGVGLTDPRLRQLALDLLPEEARAQFKP